MERTPIKLEYSPAIKLSDPIQIKIDVSQSLTFEIPKQVRSAVEPFDLFWLEDESNLKLVEEFSESGLPIETLEYKKIKNNVYELDPRLNGEYDSLTLEVRYPNKDNKALDLGFGQYYLKVTPPNNINAIQNEIVVDIPPSGQLRLELLPSINTIPFGRYRVDYYHKSDTRKPVQTQYWIIPYKKNFHTTRIVVPSPVTNPIPMPPCFYSIYNISYPFEINWIEGWLSFWFEGNNTPSEGEKLEVTYESAYTLEEIVDLDYYYYYGIPRTRYFF